MDGITIPASMHRDMIETLRREYERNVGPTNDDEVRAYSQEELVQKYTRDLRFWKQRVPDIANLSSPPSLQTICLHMITSNAVANMEKMCVQRGIREHVERALAH